MALCLSVCLAPEAFADVVDPAIDLPQYTSPSPDMPATHVAGSERMVALWLAALAGESVDDRRMACEAFLEAHQRGMPDLEPCIEPLRAIVRDTAQPLSLRQTAARTLIGMDIQAAAADIALLNAGGDLVSILLTDAALAQWNHTASAATWRDRLGNADTQTAVRRSAAAALGTIRDNQAATSLLAVATDSSEPTALRFAAAHAAGRLANADVQTVASEFADGSLLERLLAARLLAERTDEAAVALLLRLAADDEPTIAAAVLESLEPHAANAAADLAHRRALDPDPRVRLVCGRILHRLADAKAVATLAKQLADTNTRVRRAARVHLRSLAGQPALRDAVAAATVAVLAQPDANWQAIEQASLLAGSLDLDDQASRLVDVARDHERHETRLAALYALRLLAVPETADAVLALAELRVNAGLRQAADLLSMSPQQIAGAQRQAAQVQAEAAQALAILGTLQHLPAEALGRKVMAKGSMPLGDDARTAGIWALGMMHLGSDQPKLVTEMTRRMADVAGLEPESDAVRRQCAIAIGLMKARSGLGALNRHYESSSETTDVRAAARWSIMAITANALPPLPDVARPLTDMFLEPVELR